VVDFLFFDGRLRVAIAAQAANNSVVRFRGVLLSSRRGGISLRCGSGGAGLAHLRLERVSAMVGRDS
jgi:hypothetical protein